MVVGRKPQDKQEVLVPETCPQCPGGGYDLISGARREFLLLRVNAALGLFQKNNAVDKLLHALQDAVIKGLDVSDLDLVVSSESSGGLFIGCRKITSDSKEPCIEITVIDHDKRYTVEVRESQITPLKTFTMSGCPLVGKEEQAQCIPETCPVALQAKAMTTKRA